MKEILKNDKFLKIAFFAGVIIILLLFLSGISDKFSAGQDQATAEELLEQRIEKLLSGMEGIGDNVSDVMIRLDEDGHTVIGAAIICPAANDAVIKERLLDAVSKALDVSVSKVCVTV